MFWSGNCNLYIYIYIYICVYVVSKFDFVTLFTLPSLEFRTVRLLLCLCSMHLYVCNSSSHCCLWSSAFIAVVSVKMTSNSGLCVSLICQDQSEAIAVAMGCGSHMHGVSCGAVAAEVAFCFSSVAPVMVPHCVQRLLLKAFLPQQQRSSQRHNPWAS